jgi:hypothetical protein
MIDDHANVESLPHASISAEKQRSDCHAEEIQTPTAEGAADSEMFPHKVSTHFVLKPRFPALSLSGLSLPLRRYCLF